MVNEPIKIVIKIENNKKPNRIKKFLVTIAKHNAKGCIYTFSMTFL